MFTGLVEEIGTIESIQVAGSGRDFVIRGGIVSQDAELGDSIAINGCCLTVTGISNGTLTFQAGLETLSRTNLGLLKPGDSVNLERSVRVGDRMGGHYVSGHIDCLATVEVRVDDGTWSEFWFRLPRNFTRQMASKGSVAVDGISLTLVKVELERFSVALIPHTLQGTTLGQNKVGDQVNIETDLLAKYVQQQLLRSESATP